MLLRQRSVLGIVALLIVFVVSLPVPAAAQPQGKLVIGITVDANSLDPLQINTVNPEFTLMANLFDPLVFRDSQMKVQPKLAVSWKLENDTTWVFNLRKGVKFQNGEPLDAKAVKYTFDRAMDPAQKSKDQMIASTQLQKVEIVDNYTVKFITKAPAPGMLVRLAGMYIVPPEYYSKADAQTAATKPVGSGPYKFVEWVKNDHITIEANPDYWGGAPAIKTVVFRPIPEVGTRIAELKAGGIGIALYLPPDLAKSVETDTTTVKSMEGSRIVVAFHHGVGGPTDNKLVRQAINYAVDVDAICKALQGGYSKREFTISLPAWTSPKIKPWPYDPQKAKQLLKEAGYPNGFDTVLETPAGRYAKDKEVAMAVADYLTKVGIKTTVKQYDWAEYIKIMVGRKSAPLFLFGLAVQHDGLIDIQNLRYGTVFNAAEWNHPEYQAVLKQAESTMDDAARQALIYKAQEIANDDCPWIWMYFQRELYGISKKVDWSPRPDGVMFLTDAKLVK